MVQLILIAGLVFVHLHDMLGGRVSRGGLSAWVVTALVWVPVVLAALTAWAWVAAAGRRLDRTGKVSAVGRAELGVAALRVVAVLWYAVAVFMLDWPGAVRSLIGDLVLVDELVMMLPLVGTLVFAVFVIYPIERRLREAMLLRHLNDGRPINRPWSRREYVWAMVRHQMLFVLVPVSLISAWGELVDRGVSWWGRGADVSVAGGTGSSGVPDFWVIGAQLGGVAVILAVMPLVMRVVWDTVPLAPGPLREGLTGICRRYGVRVRDLLVWRTHGTMINGAAMGIIGPARYILLSDALLESLTTPQVEAVAAHEVAHVRCRHTLWLGMAMLATVTLVAGVMAIAMQLVVPAMPASIGQVVATVASLAAGIVVMGFVSRRFEWQADAFAIKHLSSTPGSGSLSAARPAEAVGAEVGVSGDGPEAGATPAALPKGANDGTVVTPTAIAAMTGALQTVADLNGIPTERSSFRHGSIAERQRRLRALVGVPIAGLRIDRQVGVMRIAILAGLLLAGVFVTLGYIGVFDPADHSVGASYADQRR